MRIASSALRCFGFGLAASALVFASHSAHAEPRPCASVDYNAMIVDIIHSLPTGGGYSIGSDFVAPVIQNHNIGGGRHELRVYDGFPSHCTSATYALYAHLVAVLDLQRQRRRRRRLPEAHRHGPELPRRPARPRASRRLPEAVLERERRRVRAGPPGRLPRASQRRRP
jgi:hypothetical protein